MFEIDNTVLYHYSERLTEDMKTQLIASVQGGAHHMGIVYVGPAIDIRLPMTVTSLGIPQLRPQHFVCGGLLTPVGKQLAELLIEDEIDDSYSL